MIGGILGNSAGEVASNVLTGARVADSVFNWSGMTPTERLTSLPWPSDLTRIFPGALGAAIRSLQRDVQANRPMLDEIARVFLPGYGIIRGTTEVLSNGGWSGALSLVNLFRRRPQQPTAQMDIREHEDGSIVTTTTTTIGGVTRTTMDRWWDPSPFATGDIQLDEDGEVIVIEDIDDSVPGSGPKKRLHQPDLDLGNGMKKKRNIERRRYFRNQGANRARELHRRYTDISTRPNSPEEHYIGSDTTEEVDLGDVNLDEFWCDTVVSTGDALYLPQRFTNTGLIHFILIDPKKRKKPESSVIVSGPGALRAIELLKKHNAGQ